jgi:hypothetical protein
MRRLGSVIWMLIAGCVLAAGCGNALPGDHENRQNATTFCRESAPRIEGQLGRVTFTDYRDAYAAALHGGKPAVAHLHGATWRIEHLPKPPGRASNIYGVAASGSTGVWAAGAVYPGGSDGHSHALIEHWDGRRWQITPTPPQHTQATVLHDIAAEAGEVWAVGGTGNREGPAFPLRMLAERWDGHRWSSVPIPTPGRSENGLLGVAIAAPNSVWTFGQLDSGPPFVERWNGSSWRVHRFAGFAYGGGAAAILTTGPDDVWLAGLSAKGLAHQAAVRYEHWNGYTWQAIDGPKLPPGEIQISSMAARVPNDVWTVGSFTRRSLTMTASQPLIEHWNGQRWSVATGPRFKSPPPVGEPDPIIAGAALNGITVDGDGRPWAVGEQPSGHGAHEEPLVEASCRVASGGG